jgi:DNA anti-recombination protein RmuC
MSKVEITKPGLFVVVCDEVASAWTFETREDAEAYIRDKDEITGGNFGFHLYDLREITGSARSIADVLAQSREALQAAQTSARDWEASAGRLRESMVRFKRERDALKAALAEVRIEACEGLNAITDNAEFWAKAEMQRNAQALSADVAKIIDAAILPLTCRAQLEAAEVVDLRERLQDRRNAVQRLEDRSADLAAALLSYVEADSPKGGSTSKAAAHNARHLTALAALTAWRKVQS